jgi:plasmid stabilization system protein ParE
MPETPDTDPARIVADADVLAADLLAGDDDNPAREAMDVVRSHSWVELVASDRLLDDAEAVIADLADADLAAAWREAVEDLRVAVDQPAGDHPALASAYRGRAAHLLSDDEGLRSAGASAAFGSRLNVSVKTPEGFVALFDPESLYAAVEGGEYPGPDRDPRA